MSKNRIKIESKDSDGNDVVVYVTKPDKNDNKKAQLVFNKVFKEALSEDGLLRVVLENKLKEQGIWSKEKQKDLEKLNKEIRDSLIKLKKGGVKLSEAKDIAIQIRIKRLQSASLMSERNRYDAYTVEAQAENAKIDYLISRCIKDEHGERYFKNSEEYNEKSEEPFVLEAADKLVTIIYGLEEDWEADLPENQFLKKYKFVDDKLRLVNQDGKYITSDGKMINDDFQYIDEQGNVVDEDGNPIDEDGLPQVEFSPFLDDNGEPIE